MMLNHPYVKARMGGARTQVEKDILSGLGEAGKGWWETYKRLGAIPTKYGDIIPTLIFGQGYYRSMLEVAKKQGMQPEEGAEWAMDQTWQYVEMSQQSGLMINLAEWQRSGSSTGRMLGQFMSTPQQFWAKQTFDWREMWAAVRNDGLESTRFTDAVRQFGKTSVINFLVLGTLYNGMKLLWTAMLGDLPDEDDWKTFAFDSLTSPFGGIFVIGSGIQVALPALVKGDSPYGSTMLPASGVFNDAASAALFLHHLFTGEPEKMLNYADRVMRSLNPIYRDISKAVENYSE